MSTVGRTDPADFEARYRHEPDPWGFATDPYERDKYAQTLTALADWPRAARALELGCANGELTALLATRCDTLVALDAAPTAVARARARFVDVPEVEILEATIPEGLPDGPWDLVVASEVLYYLGDELFEQTLDRLTEDLRPGGLLLAVHWTGNAASHPRSAADVHARLRAHPRLEGVRRDQHPRYVLDVLQRTR
jgi:trans-aconitate methyltransferase